METTTLLLDMKESDKALLLDILDRLVPAGLEVWAFGSRARWTARETSDLDLVLRNPAQLDARLEAGLLDSLKDAFEESDLPFMVDLLDWATVSEKFRKVIEREYVVVRKSGWVGVREGWETTKLKDCCIKIGSGATPRGGKEAYLDEGQFALIRSQNILDFFFSYNGLAFIDKDQAAQLSNVEVKENDVLLNITGDSVARVCQVPNSLLPARVNQHVSIIRPDESRLIPEFLKYFLLNPKFKNHMLGLASVGGARNALTKGMIEDFEIDLPPLETQRRIAAILSALDEKTEQNRQTNQTLEAIAQALFKEWMSEPRFIGLKDYLDYEPSSMESGSSCNQVNHGSDKGWKVGKLGDVCRNMRNTIHPKDIEPNIPYVGLEHIPRKSMSLSSWGVSEDVGSQKSYFNKFNILFGKLRPYFHKVCIAPVDGICSTDVLVIEPLKKEYFSFCLNHLFSNELIAYVSGIADGTRMPRVDWKSISAYEIAIPPDDLMQEFANLTIPIYEEMIHNNEESATLSATRDTLLPKLMSGEINV